MADAGKPLESLIVFSGLAAAACARGAWCRRASCPTIGNINCRSTGNREAGMGIEILAIAAATLAIVWIIVLWGSRYFGPR
jgi:hypothetical protein